MARHGMTGRCRIWFLVALLALGSAQPAHVEAQSPLRGLDAEIESVMEAWKIPGAAVAIVHNDRVIHAKGYGVREVGQPDQVDEATLFAIGSASKAFTAAAVAMLVDEGLVGWNDLVIDHMPDFRLNDPQATREMRVRDLLAHNSGLLRGDRIWYAQDRSRDQVLHQVRYLEPTWSLRANFGYQNIMYIAAGELVEAVSGRSWDAFVAERIFEPLGMSQSNTSVKDLAGNHNLASPHIPDEDTPRPVPYRNIDNAGPAGSINSNVVEMSEWVRLHLANGIYGGERLLSEASIREMHRPQMLLDYNDPVFSALFHPADFMTYGLGWFVSDYRDFKLVGHGGNIDGMTAWVAFAPERNYGLVILTNLNAANGFSIALSHSISDRLVGAEPTDWSALFLESLEELMAMGEAQQQAILDARVEGTQPSVDLAAYAGTYQHPMYGDFVVEHTPEGLTARFGPAFLGPVEHWHYDTFRADWEDAAAQPEFLRFTLDLMGQPAVLLAEIEGTAEFRRKQEGS